MKIVYNRFIPLPGFKAMLFFGILFVRKGCTLSSVNLNHESIHECQATEWCRIKFFGYCVFYITYLFMWLWNLIFHTKTAYQSIPYEKEAYANQKNLYYISTRRPFAWFKR